MAQYGKLPLAWSFYEEAKARLIEAITEEHSDQEAIEDHYEINVNRVWAKLQKILRAA